MPVAFVDADIGSGLVSPITTGTVSPGSSDRALLAFNISSYESSAYSTEVRQNDSSGALLDQFESADIQIDIFGFTFAYVKSYGEAGTPNSPVAGYNVWGTPDPWAMAAVLFSLEGVDQSTPYDTEQVSTQTFFDDDPEIVTHNFTSLDAGQYIAGSLYLFSLGDNPAGTATPGGDVENVRATTIDVVEEGRHVKIVAFDGHADGSGNFSPSFSVDWVNTGELIVAKYVIVPVNASAGGPAPTDIVGDLDEASDTVAGTATSSISASGTLSEAADTLTASAVAAISASAATLDAADSVSSAVGAAVALAGALTEAPDTAAGTAASSLAATGTVSVGTDTVTSAATNSSSSSAAITEQPDTLVASALAGDVPTTDITASITEAPNTASSTAASAIAATSALSEAADTASGTLTSAIAATGALTEAPDTLSSVVTAALSALAAITESPDTIAAEAVGPGGIICTLSVTEANDTVTSTATTSISVSATVTEAADTASASAALSSLISVAITEQADTASAVVALVVVCSAAMTEAADTLVSLIRQLGPDLPVPTVLRGYANSGVIFDLGLLAIRADGSVTIIL